MTRLRDPWVEYFGIRVQSVTMSISARKKLDVFLAMRLSYEFGISGYEQFLIVSN